MKFRVWNVKEERYEDSENYFINGNGYLAKKYFRSSEYNTIEIQLLLQQDYKIEYGIEINNIIYYEGDVVEVQYNHIGKKVVEFDNGKFNIIDYNLSKCKIIDNININKDLLKC